MRGGPEVVTERVMAMNRRYHPAVWACMEALYQSVYAQVFATKWSSLINYPLATRMALAREDAENAARAAVSGFSFAAQDKAVTEKGQQL